MKRALLFVCTIALFSAVPCFAWHCPTGQHWVQVASGTPGATIVEGIPFACFPDSPTPKDPTSSNSNSSSTANSSSSASSQATASSSQSQKQGQSQSQTANGGQATSTATGGNAVNEGNSLSTSYVNNQPRQAPMAYAPEAFSTAACRAGASAGVSAPIGGISIGGSKKDKDCERAVLANGFFSRGNYVAGCKLLMHVGVIKEALTFDECIIAVTPKPAPVAEALQVQPNIIVNIPAPVVLAPPVVVAEKPQVVTVTAKTKKRPARKTNPCPIKAQPKGEK